eukprot:364415-Chlamydomonas_euryale.AAC.4
MDRSLDLVTGFSCWMWSPDLVTGSATGSVTGSVTGPGRMTAWALIWTFSLGLKNCAPARPDQLL